MRKWMRSNKVNGLITINRHAWDSRPSSDIPVVFLNSFDCPDEVPRIVYDPQKIGIEGVRILHNLYLNHEFGLPASVMTVAIKPELHFPANPRGTSHCEG